MNKRRLIADNSEADIFVSIHQNSFQGAAVKGAQAFYFGDSEKGKQLAQLIQEQFTTYLDRNNKRAASANQQYFVLKRTKIPSVLIECGYLTNPNEKELLTTEEYQNKVAWAVYMGILNYFANN
jgi:N-acetylmuramoyl-L-alanine amidase